MTAESDPGEATVGPLSRRQPKGLDPKSKAAKDASLPMKPTPQNFGLPLGSEPGARQIFGRRPAQLLGALVLLAHLLGAAAGCAARSPSARSPASAGLASSQVADAQDGAAIPFSLCRGFGTAGTPCYPTNVDLGSRTISACRERQRGHCELSGPRHTMACLLAPLPDGKACGDTGVCKDGSCITP